jgi:hypothetical protein
MSHVIQNEMCAEPEPEIPDFKDAAKRLKEFLASHNLSPEPLWIFREDVVWRKQRIYVTEPLPQGNEIVAESLYERGRQRNLGIRLETLCLLGSHPCCYVWLPEDQMDAEYALLLMSKFIISAPNELKRAEPVRNPLTWRAYKFFEGKPAWISMVERLPRRNI